MSTPPRLFQMDNHQRAMREATPPRRHSPQSQAPALVPSPAPVQLDAVANAKGKRKRARHGKKTESKTNVAVPIVLPMPPLYEARSAEQPRKEAIEAERDELARQVRELEAQLDLLRLQAGLPTKAEKQGLVDTRDRNAGMGEMVHANRQLVGQLQSMASQQLKLPPVNPLATYIHLPCDKAQRCTLLQAMKGVKLRRAAEDGIARFRDLEDSLSYLREKRFTTDDGTHHCNRFEVAVYPQFKTARQMYDALLFWIHNLDISVTEMIDHVALREDKDDMGPTIWNQRLVTIVPDVGCTEELNMVGFAQFFENYDLMDGAPLGVIAQDSVDEDDLYPYKPLERTRKDVHMYYLFSEYVDPVTQHKSVQFKLALFNGQLAPKFPVEPHTIAKLHEYMSRWCELTNQYLTNFIVPP